MIHRPPFFVPFLYPSLIWRVKTSEKKVFLTFDDGPVPGPTDFVVETLEKFGAHATFFCIGDNIRKHGSNLMKIVRAGHTVANHTHNHLKGWTQSVDNYVMNVKMCDMEITSHGLEQPTLFRPPYGRIRRSQISALPDYRIIMWDVLTYDYSDTISPENCLRGSLKAVRPGSIIVFHDSYKAEKNMTFALPRMLEQLAGEGYSFDCL